jgi:hypothetical protein
MHAHHPLAQQQLAVQHHAMHNQITNLKRFRPLICATIMSRRQKKWSMRREYASTKRSLRSERKPFECAWQKQEQHK